MEEIVINNNNSKGDLSTRGDIDQINFNNSAEVTEVDGGFGWIVVAACFLIQSMTLGFIFSYGVVLEHYKKIWIHEASFSTLAFIGTLASSMACLTAGVGGILASYIGFSLATFVGGCIFTLGIFLASFATKIWHLFLTQGVMVGLGGSIMFIATASAPSHWFNKRRGLATGICLTGSGIGGLIVSPLTQLMIDKIAIEWTLRAFAISFFAIVCVASPFVKTRSKTKCDNKATSNASLKEAEAGCNAAPLGEGEVKKVSKFNWRIIQNKRFLALFMSEFVSCFGYLIPLLLMPTYASSKGLSEIQSAMLLGLLNGGSAIGSVTMGFLGDYLGPLNVLNLAMLLRGLLCVGLWTWATRLETLIVFNVLYGITAGAFLSLTPVVISRLFGLEDLASINGLIYLGSGIPELVGTPIGTMILKASSTPDHLNFIPVILFAGISAIVAAIAMVYIKLMVNPNFFRVI